MFKEEDEVKFDNLIEIINFYKDIDTNSTTLEAFEKFISYRKLSKITHEEILLFLNWRQIFCLQYYDSVLKVESIISVYIQICEQYLHL